METCPKCGGSLFISRSYTTLEGDTLADAKVWTNVEQVCRNPRCEDYQRVVDTVKIEQEIAR